MVFLQYSSASGTVRIMSLPHCSSGFPCAAYDANRAVHRDPRKPAGQGRTGERQWHLGHAGSELSVLGRGSVHAGLVSCTKGCHTPSKGCRGGRRSSAQRSAHQASPRLTETATTREKARPSPEMLSVAHWPLWKASLRAESECPLLRPITVWTTCHRLPPLGGYPALRTCTG